MTHGSSPPPANAFPPGWLGALAIVAVASFGIAAISAQPRADGPGIVLVHGMNGDGSSWRPVRDSLVGRGFAVTIAQLPLTGFANDLAAVQRTLDRTDDNVLLVGHSYGGILITSVGNDLDVSSLVCVAALQPDVGETMGSVNERMPSAFVPAGSVIGKDGYVTVTREALRRDVGPNLSESELDFIQASQTPTATDLFQAPTEHAVWRDKPSLGIVATQDRVVSPELQRRMYGRAGGPVVEVDASHIIPTEPADVANAIAETADGLATR